MTLSVPGHKVSWKDCNCSCHDPDRPRVMHIDACCDRSEQKISQAERDAAKKQDGESEASHA